MSCYLVHLFMFSNFYQSYIHNETCVALTNLQGRNRKNRVMYSISHDLVKLMIEGHVC